MTTVVSNDHLLLQQQQAAAIAAASAASAAHAEDTDPHCDIDCMLSMQASIFNIHADIHASSVSRSTRRFKPVPAVDAFLCYLSQDAFHLHPPAYPSYIPSSMSAAFKLRAMLMPQTIGTLSPSGTSITLRDLVLQQVELARRQQQVRCSGAKETVLCAEVSRELTLLFCVCVCVCVCV